jgi:3-hydroxyisobutyrate dehydrogenase
MEDKKNDSAVDIGWIGTGIMGQAMCGHLITAGHRLYIYNRSRSKADPLVERGAVWCVSPREASLKSAVVFTMVGYPHDVHEVILGAEGVLAGLAAGGIVVDMSTSSPDLAATINQVARERRIDSLDAPVSGGDIGAREATLAIMVGGEKSAFERTLPLLKLLGRNIAWLGPAGSGQHTKMCNQIAIAGTIIGTVESLLYAHRAGLKQDAVIDIIGQGAAGSWTLNNLGRRIVRGDFAPGFMIRHFVKDMGIALAEAGRMKLSLPGLALVHQFYLSALAQGEENLGTQGLYRILDRMNRSFNDAPSEN